MRKYGGKRIRRVRHWWYTTPTSRIAMVLISAGLACAFAVIIGLLELGH
jgi:hypothetical protein